MSTIAKTNNRPSQLASDQKLIDGLNKHANTITALVIGGASYKTGDIIAILQARVNAGTGAQSAKPVWQAAVKADQDERAKTKTFVSGLRQALEVAFAGAIDSLADFGLSPRKQAVRTPEQKAAAALKAKATRTVRNTMGKVQKAQVKGAVTITPAKATPIVPAPAPAPAPAPVTATAPATATPAAPVTAAAPTHPLP